ncbi:HDOD domain-containing protein [Aquabacterium sp. OR-4]|uniref:HDOD domain-containing protein n=1 Tax=Aquabacterium sp. OR-4 TaxID=2978127 RepID=UPI0021B19CB2|nr:HDOD domain-containing protein [Aquabacterium sp. OR-4]MDT7834283.1 HDOD domain-containing protein [Aquabacterium sp. OR-4]
MQPSTTSAAAPPFLTRAPVDVAGWVRAFDSRELPVLADSARLLDDLRSIEDDVDAHMIAEGIAEDPLMILKLLRHVALLRRTTTREHTDAETATEALVMLGITPFFRDFGPQPTLEDGLAGHPLAMLGLREVIRRARRSARFALAFAVHRQDHDAAVIHEAALLHDFAEMLLWVHAPAMALDIARYQHQDPNLRSVDAQRAVLNVPLSEVQQALMKAWRLPELLVRISDDQASDQTQVRNVQLAIRVARHSAHGWANPALPDDVDEIASLLTLGTTPTWTLLHEIDG